VRRVFFSVAIVSFFLLTFVSLYALFLSLYTRMYMYVVRRVLDAFRCIFHYDCATIDVIFCYFERIRFGLQGPQFFYISVFIILLLYFCFSTFSLLFREQTILL